MSRKTVFAFGATPVFSSYFGPYITIWLEFFQLLLSRLTVRYCFACRRHCNCRRAADIPWRASSVTPRYGDTFLSSLENFCTIFTDICSVLVALTIIYPWHGGGVLQRMWEMLGILQCMEGLLTVKCQILYILFYYSLLNFSVVQLENTLLTLCDIQLSPAWATVSASWIIMYKISVCRYPCRPLCVRCVRCEWRRKLADGYWSPAERLWHLTSWHWRHQRAATPFCCKACSLCTMCAL